MNWARLAAAGVLVACVSAPAATICGTGTLASYIGLGPAGCSVGSSGLFFEDFSFSVVSSSGGAVALGASDITVTPVISPSGYEFGLNFDPPGFSVGPGQFIQYMLAYTCRDPPIIHGFDMFMFDPPTPPGSATITSTECLGAAFTGTVCPTTAITQTVFDDGIAPSLRSTRFFAPVSIVGDITIITLDARMGGTADIVSFTESAITPEPGSAVLAGAGLFLLITFLTAARIWRDSPRSLFVLRRLLPRRAPDARSL